MSDTIQIEQLSSGEFTVRLDDRYADRLTFDEMIGVVAALTMPTERPCLQWMRTQEQHDREAARLVEIRERRMAAQNGVQPVPDSKGEQ